MRYSTSSNDTKDDTLKLLNGTKFQLKKSDLNVRINFINFWYLMYYWRYKNDLFMFAYVYIMLHVIVLFM